MNPETYIEQASPSDLDQIMAIEDACFASDAFSRRQILYLIQQAKGLFLVAKQDGKITGYVSILTSRRHHVGRMYSLAVSPAFRGQKIGETLFCKALEYAQDKKLRAVFLEVRTDNTTAISLYEKCGFKKRSVFANYYHDGADAYSMVYPIRQDK